MVTKLCYRRMSSLASFSRCLIGKRCLIATSLRLQARPFQQSFSEQRCFSTVMSATPEQLLSFINSSPTPFHLVKEAEVSGLDWTSRFESICKRPMGEGDRSFTLSSFILLVLYDENVGKGLLYI